MGLGDEDPTEKQMEKEKAAGISLILRCHQRSEAYFQTASQLHERQAALA